jgi:hypothetical protein
MPYPPPPAMNYVKSSHLQSAPCDRRERYVLRSLVRRSVPA